MSHVRVKLDGSLDWWIGGGGGSSYCSGSPDGRQKASNDFWRLSSCIDRQIGESGRIVSNSHLVKGMLLVKLYYAGNRIIHEVYLTPAIVMLQTKPLDCTAACTPGVCMCLLVCIVSLSLPLSLSPPLSLSLLFVQNNMYNMCGYCV